MDRLNAIKRVPLICWTENIWPGQRQSILPTIHWILPAYADSPCQIFNGKHYHQVMILLLRNRAIFKLFCVQKECFVNNTNGFDGGLPFFKLKSKWSLYSSLFLLDQGQTIWICFISSKSTKIWHFLTMSHILTFHKNEFKYFSASSPCPIFNQ